MKSHRLFFALWPDNETRRALIEWQSFLTGRKIPFSNIHMTLIFLGEQPKETLPIISQLLTTISFKPIELTLNKIGYFSHSQISWAGIKKTPASLLTLYDQLFEALVKNSISFDKRNKFKPHITLARNSNRPNLIDLKPIFWKANQLLLIESRFIKTNNGTYPQYIPIAKYPLNKDL